jgi:hypothetical protein
MKRSRGAVLAAATHRLGLSVQNRPPKPDQPHPPYWA